METQYSNIKVTRENLRGVMRGDCGGGYRVVEANIVVDDSLPHILQKEAVIHEILGLYLGAVIHHEILEQIATSIADGLEALE